MTERRTIAGRYVLLAELASGGMATVHFGQMIGPGGFNKVVAIKRLHPHLAKDPACAALFLDEARLAARIRHANVVPTLDIVADGSDVFLVMEYVVGASLANLLEAAKGPLPIDVAAKIVLDVLEGLHAAHEARDAKGQRLRIVHRDVSPQNVIVGTDGVARVLDFGIAKALGRSQTTRDGSVKGKASYMAPEQVRGESVDARTDVYAAGVMFWELVTGCGLFPADTPHAAMMRACLEPAPPPSHYAPNVSAALDEVILRAVAKSADTRYATAQAFADAIEHACAAASTRAVSRYVAEVGGDVVAERAMALEISSQAARSAPPPAQETVLSATLPQPPELTPRPRAASAPAIAATPNAQKPLAPATDQHTAFDGVLVNAPRARARYWALAAGVLTGLAGAGVFMMARMRITADTPVAAATAETSTSTSTSTSTPTSTSTSTPTPTPTSTSTSATASGGSLARPSASVVTPTSTPRPTVSVARKPARKANCDPPWRLDAEGVRVLKPECQE